jgi:hypothetical protein
MKDKYYLHLHGDSLDEAEMHRTKGDAVASYEETARSLDRYGQRLEGSVHKAPSRREIVEYPDFALSLGPRGGVRCMRT